MSTPGTATMEDKRSSSAVATDPSCYCSRHEERLQAQPHQLITLGGIPCLATTAEHSRRHSPCCTVEDLRNIFKASHGSGGCQEPLWVWNALQVLSLSLQVDGEAWNHNGGNDGFPLRFCKPSICHSLYKKWLKFLVLNFSTSLS